MKSSDDHVDPVGHLANRLGEIVARGADKYRITPGGMEVNGVCLQWQIRSLQASGERILETIALHVVRQGNPKEARRFLVIQVPRIPRDLYDDSSSLNLCQPARLAPWVIISDAGGYLAGLRGETVLQEEDSLVLERTKNGRLPVRQPRDPVRNDLSNALLKILLLQKSEPFWSLDDKITSVDGLAGRMSVSTQALYGVLSDLTELGLVASRHGQLPIIIDRVKVINIFMDDAKHRQPVTLGVAPLYEKAWQSQQDVLEWLAKHAHNIPLKTWAIMGWWALKMYGRNILTHPQVKPVDITSLHQRHVLLSAWNLRVTAPGEPTHLRIASCTMPVATFGLMRELTQNIPVVDIWQAALDVAGDPQRGIDQTSVIADDLFLNNSQSP